MLLVDKLRTSVPKAKIGLRVGTLGALGVIGLVLVGGIYLTGQRYETSLQQKADLAIAARDQFATVLAHLADARQAEIGFELHPNEAQFAIHSLALDKANTALAGLIRPGMPETTVAGARLLGTSVADYGAKSAAAFETQRAVAPTGDDNPLTTFKATAAEVEQSFLWSADERAPVFILSLRLRAANFELQPTKAAVDEFDSQVGVFIATASAASRMTSGEKQSLINDISRYDRDFDAYAAARLAAVDAAFASDEAFETARVAGDAARGLSAYQAETEQAALAAAQHVTGRLMRLSITLVALAVGVIAWLIGRGIARPLSEVAQQTNQLTLGDRSFAIRHTQRGDEVGDVARALSVFRDTMDQNAAASRRIYDLAHYDALTKLANRVLLQHRLTEAVARAAQADKTFAVLCLDLDGFKAINDLYGHAAGDALLQEVAARLSRNMRENDTAGRLGGDEFAIIQDVSSQPGAGRALAERLMKAIAEPYELSFGYIRGIVTTSIGVAVFPAHGIDPGTLLRNADIALYRSKATGKNKTIIFEPEMDRALRERRILERDLGQALGKGEFSLVWQPLASSATGTTVKGYEVLLRWERDGHTTLSPEVFIPVAESTGSIIQIGEWVLRSACEEAATWDEPLGIAVNVSPVQAQQGTHFVKIVEQALGDSGLNPARLTLEVTEGVLIRDTERVLGALRQIKALGVQIALDDFGTGYSSLATLRAFPFDKIKIDRSFIVGIASGGQDTAIVRAVLGLARGLGLPTVAEGVETEAQLAVLRETGCEEVQGWLIGRPAPIRSFRTLEDAASGDLRVAASSPHA
jgi:diguanylate cyclase (GGDEF)-like protein